MRKKLKNRGSALVEYAIILSFVSAIGFSFAGDKGFAGSITGIINGTTKVLGQAIGLQTFDEEALKKDLIGLKDSGGITCELNYTEGRRLSLGSPLVDDGDYRNGNYETSVNNSQNLYKNILSQIDFGEVPLESWRYINETRQDGLNSAFLVWSDSQWDSDYYYSDKARTTPMMYAKIYKKDNTVTFGVGYGNPMHIAGNDGRINGWHTNNGGMVEIDKGIPSNKVFFNPWDGNKMLYRDSNSPVFTSDYNKAVSLYKDLKAATQK